MTRLSLTKLAAGFGGIAFALSAATGVAAADPMDAVINTTCNYGQVMAALNATDPASAAQFNKSPVAQSFLNNFLAAAPPERAQMAQQIPPRYMGVIQRVAGVCNNY
jgi:hemophore-related protein